MIAMATHPVFPMIIFMLQPVTSREKTAVITVLGGTNVKLQVSEDMFPSEFVITRMPAGRNPRRSKIDLLPGPLIWHRHDGATERTQELGSVLRRVEKRNLFAIVGIANTTTSPCYFRRVGFFKLFNRVNRRGSCGLF
jgi:hypothetical protein